MGAAQIRTVKNTHNFSTYSKVELDKLLVSFYVDARKKDGRKYKLSSLKTILVVLACPKIPSFVQYNNNCILVQYTAGIVSYCLASTIKIVK